MSPFEQVVADLSRGIRLLPAQGQSALFLAAARALFADWASWITPRAHQGDLAVFNQAVEWILRRILTADRVDPAELLEAIAAATPVEPTDRPGFTAAQDCWICLDTAMRSAWDGSDSSTSTWYLLEPLFQTASERRMGHSDVGSARQVEGEAVVLEEETIVAAIEAVEECVQLLQSRVVDAGLVGEVEEALTRISPKRSTS